MSRNNNSRKDNRRVPVPWDECREECMEGCREECREEYWEEYWEQEEYWEGRRREVGRFWPSEGLIQKDQSASPSKSSLNTVNANKSLCY